MPKTMLSSSSHVAPPGACGTGQISIGRPPAQGDLLEPVRGEEADPLAIGREEGRPRTLGPVQGFDIETIHPPDEQLGCRPVVVDVDERHAVRREREGEGARRVVEHSSGDLQPYGRGRSKRTSPGRRGPHMPPRERSPRARPRRRPTYFVRLDAGLETRCPRPLPRELRRSISGHRRRRAGGHVGPW